LVEGKKGEELDAAIQEFDRHHVPEVVTRFEAPLTARMYRRSSSAPVADTDTDKKQFLRSTSSSRSQRVRAASTQPTRNPSPSLTETSSPVELCPTHFYDVSFNSGFASTEFSFPPKTEPSFDFNPFFFKEGALPYDSPPLASGDNNGVGMFSQDMSQRPRTPLSITTSFSQDWMTTSPFSSSPSTPQIYSQHHSPCMSQLSSAADDTFSLANFDLDSFDHASAFDRPLDMDGGAFLASEFESLSKDSAAFGSYSKPQLAGQDLDFSAFMSSLHASTYTI